MSTISVPLSPELQNQLDNLVKQGVASTRSAAVRKAIKLLAEKEAIEAVLRAEREPSLSGNLDDLLKKFPDEN